MGRWLSRVDRGDRHRRPPDDEQRIVPKPYVPPGEDVPTVPFLPVRCPRCGAGKPITDGVYRAKLRRYHTCQECDLKYRSIEIGLEDLAD